MNYFLDKNRTHILIPSVLAAGIIQQILNKVKRGSELSKANSPSPTTPHPPTTKKKKKKKILLEDLSS